MNMESFRTFVAPKQYQLNSYLLIFILMCAFSGCKLTSDKAVTPTISEYYLWLKSLPVEALSDEFTRVNNNTSTTQSPHKNHAQLALLYAIPKANQHNPYTAKTILNQLNKSHLSAFDLAFIELLSEQLNQQIIALNKNVLSTKALENMQKENNDLEEQVNKLTTQINQLKSIERDIQPQELN
ncbi:hypothetical protein Q4489_08440 [Thalassotalea sp. 1_MG-2023]|uniref:hypothetical protein n=1 Tax=Thalassotalea sp. 1_MG-2023 TaxID=3062680 RepID=UPI0026E32221|nr:hypothetical protein [Thalassotalea sp. 1_MG-2023]MDO6427036.1 hypothetical protein [Thalassotalea sp. 1_MG-2023]